MCFSLAMGSFSTNVTHLVLSQGIGFGIGGCIAYSPSILFMPDWFDKRRGWATGMLYCGATLGGTTFPLALNALLQSVGFRWTLRAQALIQLGIGVVLFMLLKPRLPITDTSADRKGGLRELLPTAPRALFTPLGIWLVSLTFVSKNLA